MVRLGHAGPDGSPYAHVWPVWVLGSDAKRGVAAGNARRAFAGAPSPSARLTGLLLSLSLLPQAAPSASSGGVLGGSGGVLGGSGGVLGGGGGASSSGGVLGGGFSWENRKRLDPKDFQATGLRGELFVREPGSINGQAFVVEDCRDSTIVLLDHMAQITVDDCVNCRIIVGPVESSIFMRTSERCSVAVVCRQFRTRDLKDCDFALHCVTRPIIEESKDLRMACFDLDYDGLEGQLGAVGMSAFANHWSHIHDFTPRAKNWTFTDEGKSARALLEERGSGAPAGADADDAEAVAAQQTPPALPDLECLRSPAACCVRTRGERPTSGEVGFVLLPPSSVAGARDALSAALAKGNGSIALQRTNAAKVSPGEPQDTLLAMLGAQDETTLRSSLAAAKSVGLELVGEGARAVAEEVAAVHGGFAGGSDAAQAFVYLGVTG